MSDAAFDFSYERVQSSLRQAGISCEVDYQRRSVKAAMRQADKKKVDWVILVGEDEMKEMKVTLKNMKNGEQELLPLDQVVKKIS